MEWKEGDRRGVFPLGHTWIVLLLEIESQCPESIPAWHRCFDLNDCAPFLFHSEILIYKLALLFGGVSFSGHLCYLHWAVSFIYHLNILGSSKELKRLKEEARRYMQLSFGLTGLDWKVLPQPLFFLSMVTRNSPSSTWSTLTKWSIADGLHNLLQWHLA